MWKRVLVATGFNLLFEYSMRGVNNLQIQPILPLILFMTYFTLFTMLDDLISRYSLRDFHLIVVAFSYGMIYQCLVSGAAFLPPLFLGMNWRSIFFVILVWWGALQNIMTFYLANRVSPRTHNGSKLSRRGWIIALSLNTAMIWMFQGSGQIPRGTMLGYSIMSLVATLSVLLSVGILKGYERSSHPQFTKSRFMDLLSLSTIIIFFSCASFLTFDSGRYGASNINWAATRVIVPWTTFVAVVMLAYRLFSKKPIPV